jgi:effector-binding domain-containing protein
MRRVAFIVVVCVIAGALWRRGLADPVGPATQPDPGFVVSDMRVRTVSGYSYLYDTSQTSFAKIAEPIGRMIPALDKGIADGKFHPTGPLVMTYRGVTDMSQPFTLDVGYMVPKETATFDQFKVRQEDSFKCATVLYSGPLSKISEAYGKLYAAIGAAGLKPTMTVREIYLFWEGPESPNNVIQIQMGI